VPLTRTVHLLTQQIELSLEVARSLRALQFLNDLGLSS
jgi:hypothetical protein